MIGSPIVPTTGARREGERQAEGDRRHGSRVLPGLEHEHADDPKKSFSTAAARTLVNVAVGMVTTNISTVTSVPACAGVMLLSATPVA
jgi:hypothetical protein